jgi:hypothetical protein
MKKIIIYWITIALAIISVIPIFASYLPIKNENNSSDLQAILFLNTYLTEMNSTCQEKTYYTKAICFYQPENEQCPIYCKDYRLLCLNGKYVLQKDEENFACHTVEDWKMK